MASYTNVSDKELDLFLEDREVFMRNFATVFTNNMLLRDELKDTTTRFSNCKAIISNAMCVIMSDDCRRLSKNTKQLLIDLLTKARDA